MQNQLVGVGNRVFISVLPAEEVVVLDVMNVVIAHLVI